MPPASTTGRETPTDMTAPPGAEVAFAGSTVPPALMERWRELTVNAPLGDLDPTLGRVTEDLTPGALADVPEGVVALGDPIARGGMGEVRRGTQHRLRREVAVKRALRETAAAGRGAMLREAWVAASLEHPNILPIHTLSREGDEPLIVMKRVEGRVWSDILEDERDPDAPGFRVSRPSVSGMGDRWVAPLQVLIEVCRAVHFAHTRGVLHLDIKPDNVMVGEHGEVVLLDWGLATAFDQRIAPSFLRPRESIEAVCGTPGYLSPEQAEGIGSALTPTTDVYLLGAVLYEVLTGQLLHPGPVVKSLLSSHRAEPPVLGDDVPAELRELTLRALARDPRDRFPDVASFRQALEAFLAHRPALALTARGDGLLAALLASPQFSGEDDDLSAEVSIDACRFAYQQALRLWPESRTASAGLARLSEWLLNRAEARIDANGGRAALDDHPAPGPELRQRLAALEQASVDDGHRLVRLRALSADEDVETYRRVRIGLAAGGGALWLLWNLCAGWLDRSGILPLTHAALLANVCLAALSFGLFMALGGHRSLLSTAVNRRALTVILATFGQTFVLWTGAWLLDVPPRSAAALAGAAYLLAALAVAAILDARTWWVSLLMLVPAMGGALMPATPTRAAWSQGEVIWARAAWAWCATGIQTALCGARWP
jgi:hypothetical protein